MPRESRKARRERVASILTELASLYPDSRCSLDHANPLQLVVATVLTLLFLPALYAAWFRVPRAAAI